MPEASQSPGSLIIGDNIYCTYVVPTSPKQLSRAAQHLFSLGITWYFLHVLNQKYLLVFSLMCVCRDPGQLLSTSNTLLLKVVTLQVGDDGSGSDDNTSVNSEGEVGPRYNINL